MSPKGIPEIEARKFQGKNAYFHLEPLDLLKEHEGRLIIDWGKSARMWHQKGTTEKPVVAIQADEKKVFSGFENLILTYDDRYIHIPHLLYNTLEIHDLSVHDELI